MFIELKRRRLEVLEQVKKEAIIGNEYKGEIFYEALDKVYHFKNGSIKEVKLSEEFLNRVRESDQVYLGKRRLFRDEELGIECKITLTTIKMWNKDSELEFSYIGDDYSWVEYQQFKDLLRKQETLETLAKMLNTSEGYKEVVCKFNKFQIVGLNINEDYATVATIFDNIYHVD